MAPTKEELVELYWGKELSGREVARKLGVPAPTVFSWMKQRDIKLRPHNVALSLYQDKYPEQIAKFSEAGVKSLKGRKQSAQTIQKRVSSRKGYTHSEETRKKMSLSLKGRKWTKEQRERLLPILKISRLKRPTKIECAFQEIINKFNLPYKYVGDGYTWIAGRCPDFINVNGKKTVVEIFGRWWHDPSRNPKVKSKYTEKETTAHYAEYGFSCIVIWEEELLDEDSIIQKLECAA